MSARTRKKQPERIKFSERGPASYLFLLRPELGGVDVVGIVEIDRTSRELEWVATTKSPRRKTTGKTREDAVLELEKILQPKRRAK